MKNIEINQKVKGSTHDFSWGALDVVAMIRVRSGGGQDLLELGPPLGAFLPLVPLGWKHLGDLGCCFGLDRLCGSSQQLRKPLLEDRNDAVTHHLAEAGNRIVVDAREERLDERHQSFDRLVLVRQRLVFLVVDEPPKHGGFDLHRSPPVLNFGMCHRVETTRLLSHHKRSIIWSMRQAQIKNQHLCCFEV